MKIRTTRTASGSIAVQVVEYIKRKKVILRHIGSARDDEQLALLKSKALEWIYDNDQQRSLFCNLAVFNDKSSSSDDYGDHLVQTNYESVSSRHLLLYDVLRLVIRRFGFDLFKTNQISLLNDLIIARIAFPSSKVESLEFLEEYFAIYHSYRTLTYNFKKFSNFKDEAERKVIEVASNEFGFDFNVVFYDLTTLYFESFKDDELRKVGFSKDNKINQPQIMIGLVVNSQGFPISYQLFEGNKFEGHTLIPVILELKNKHQIKNMTVVADAAMISQQNISYLIANKLDYIVGARIANLPIKTIERISKELNGVDEATIRIETAKDQLLICHFSKSRYRKDKSDMEKQVAKANNLLKVSDPNPASKRAKFLKQNKDNKKTGYSLNLDLIHKTKLLLGIKGYHSNLDNLNDLDIIGQYRNLWQVEKAFRISKTDLKMRPIYHFKECTIKSHLVICFMALAISKYIEIKTGKSIKSVIKSLKKSPNSVIINKNSGKEIVLKAKIDEEIKKLVEMIDCGTNIA